MVLYNASVKWVKMVENDCMCVCCIILKENYRMGGAYQWPGLNEVMEYRKTVRQLVCDLISSSSLSLPVSMDNPWVSSQQWSSKQKPNV